MKTKPYAISLALGILILAVLPLIAADPTPEHLVAKRETVPDQGESCLARDLYGQNSSEMNAETISPIRLDVRESHTKTSSVDSRLAGGSDHTSGVALVREFSDRLHNVFMGPTSIFDSLDQDFPDATSYLLGFLLEEAEVKSCTDKDILTGGCPGVDDRMAAIDLLEGLGALETPESAATAQLARQALERLVTRKGQGEKEAGDSRAQGIRSADRLDALAALTRLAPYQGVLALRRSFGSSKRISEEELRVVTEALINLGLSEENQTPFLSALGVGDAQNN